MDDLYNQQINLEEETPVQKLTIIILNRKDDCHSFHKHAALFHLLFRLLTVSSEIICGFGTLTCCHRQLLPSFLGSGLPTPPSFTSFSDRHVTLVLCPKSERAGRWPQCLHQPDLALASDTKGALRGCWCLFSCHFDLGMIRIMLRTERKALTQAIGCYCWQKNSLH